jgi:hypothetical protein
MFSRLVQAQSLEAACLIFPEAVNSASSISATNSGRTQWMSRLFFGGSPSSKAARGVSSGASPRARSAMTSSPQTVWMRLTYRSLSPSQTPASRELKRDPSVRHPPITTSTPGRHLVFTHSSLFPER